MTRWSAPNLARRGCSIGQTSAGTASSRAPSYYSLAGIALLPLTALALLVSLLFALALKAARVLGRDLIDLRAFDFAYHAGWLAGPGLWFCLLRAPCLLARARFDLLLDFAGEKDLCPVPWLLGRLRWPLGPTRRLLSLARCRRTADVARDTGLEDYESERSRVERRTSLRMLYRTNRFSGSGAQDETCRTRLRDRARRLGRVI